MATLYIVIKNLKLWLGVDRRLLGKQQVSVRLLGIGLPGILPHNDFAIEDRLDLSIEDAFVEFATNAMWLHMVNPGVVVDMALTRSQVEAVQRAVAALTVQHDINVVSDQRPAQRNRMRDKIAAAAETGLECGDVEGCFVFPLQLA